MFGIGHGGEKYRCLGALLGAEHERLQHPPAELGEAAALTDPSGDDSGMKAGGDDLAGVEPRRELPREQDIAKLGAAIGPHHRPIPPARQVAEIDMVAAV